MNDLFSERYGYIARKLQYEYLNEFSKAHLWDEINYYFLQKAQNMHDESDHEYKIDKECFVHASSFYYNLHRNFWGKSNDDFLHEPSRATSGIKNVVMNTMWHNVFDVIEALIRISDELIPNKKRHKAFLKEFHAAINNVFQEQRCAYRLIDGVILPNVNNIEVVTITNALVDTDSIMTVNAHLEQAIKHYSDRQNPDYRNAIKESISALESLLKIIAGTRSATFDGALKSIVRNNTVVINEQLQESMKSLYAWTNSEGGVRHGLKGDSKIDNDDAKLAITSCCSYVSYLIAKAIKSGIDLK